MCKRLLAWTHKKSISGCRGCRGCRGLVCHTGVLSNWVSCGFKTEFWFSLYLFSVGAIKIILNNNGENHGQSTLVLCTFPPARKMLFQQDTGLEGSENWSIVIIWIRNLMSQQFFWVRSCTLMTSADVKINDWIIKSGTLPVLSAKICRETKLN